jgi:hypothetical protein
MKFKYDKEFINKVLDAQIRVNEIESNILKNVGGSAKVKTPVPKKKPNRSKESSQKK